MNDGKSCPGEAECSDPKSADRGPLAKYLGSEQGAVSGEQIETICRGCPLLKTKPEATPDELIGFVATAINLDEIGDIGGRFNYPDGLTIIEWECLRGLKRGRKKAEKLKEARDKKKK